MNNELKEMQVEGLRDELERRRVIVVDAYLVRKWLGCKNITKNRVNDLIDLFEGGQANRFDGDLRASYISEPNGLGHVILIASADVQTEGVSRNARGLV